MSGAWRKRTVTVFYPTIGEVEETQEYWDPEAEAACDRCADRGRWVSPEGHVIACPECQPEEVADE